MLRYMNRDDTPKREIPHVIGNRGNCHSRMACPASLGMPPSITQLLFGIEGPELPAAHMHLEYFDRDLLRPCSQRSRQEMQYAGNTSNDVAQLIPNTVARRVAMLMIAAHSRQAPKRF
jgi:hypothetical protein